MKTMRIAGLLLAVVCAGLSVPTLAGDAEAGKIKASTCMGCHGIKGMTNAYPVYHVPKLGGQNAQYLVDAMKAYRDGLRGHRTMHANMSNLSEQDMRDIAAWFAGEQAD